MNIRNFDFEHVCNVLTQIIEAEEKLCARLGRGKSKVLLLTPQEVQEAHQKICQMYIHCAEQMGDLRGTVGLNLSSFDIIREVKEEMNVSLEAAIQLYEESRNRGSMPYIADVMDWTRDYCARNAADKISCQVLLEDLQRLSVGYPNNYDEEDPNGGAMAEVYAPPEYMERMGRDETPMVLIYAPPEFMF